MFWMFLASQNYPLMLKYHTFLTPIGGQHRDIMKSSRVILHPKYNTAALKHRNVSEFYDYDVALVHLNKSIKVSQAARY